MLVIHIAYPCHIISILIPELSAANSNTLTDILSNDALDQKLIALIFLETLKLMLNFISNFLGLVIKLLSIISLSFEFLLNNFFNFFFGLTWSEFIFELWSDLICLFSFVRVFILSFHFLLIYYFIFKFNFEKFE